MLFAIEDEIRDFCEENVLEFESEGEFNLYIAELNLLEEKVEERGEDFDWQNGALRYYRVFRGRRDEMNAAGEQKHTVSLSAFNEQELPTLPDELIGGILRKRRKMLLVGPSKAGKTGLLMEFAPHGPVSFWYDYPVHRLDEGLSGLYVLGSREANLALSRKRLSREEKEARARQVPDDAFAALDTQGRGLVFLNDAAEQAKVTTKTLRQYADFFPEEFDCPPRKGYLRRKKKANTVPAAAPKAAS